MKTFLTFLFSVGLLILFSTAAEAGKIYAKVIGVSDGDTITVVTPIKVQIKVRLAEIDAPEKDQPYGEASKKFLSMLVFGRDVIVEINATDKYNRSIGRVFIGRTDVNLEVVKNGMAWAYKDYLKDKTILEAEESAKAKGLGLWGLQEDQRVPPWEWRQGGNKKPVVAPTAANVDDRLDCAGKVYCRQMTSCQEAYFYLTQCGLSRLDGDKDGMPCESICK